MNSKRKKKTWKLRYEHVGSIHKSSMAKLNDIWTRELAVHFNSIKYEIKEISFIAIEKIVIPEDAGHMDCY